MKKSAKDNKNKYPYDLLIPLFLMVLVCPFVVRLALVSTGLGDYLWYPEDDRIADLYSYFRSRGPLPSLFCFSGWGFTGKRPGK